MSQLIDSLVAETNSHDALTQNGAITHASTLHPVLDLFFLAGASRTMPENQIRMLFRRAFLAHPQLTMRAAFYARDIRGGAGERRFFQLAFRELISLAEGHAQARAAAQSLIFQIPEYGTWKDVWTLFSHEEKGVWYLNKTKATRRGLRYRAKQSRQVTKYRQDAVPTWALEPVLEELMKPAPSGLLCKWLPLKGPLFKQLVAATGMTRSALQARIKAGRKVVEQQMSAGAFGDIEYSHVPGVAMKRYLKAFKRRDATRFDAFIADVNDGRSTMHAGTVFPHDIVARIRRGEYDVFDALKAQWASLRRPLIGAGRRVIAVSDVSGSMTFESAKISSSVYAIDVSIALGLYFAEQVDGPFRDTVITFSNIPKVRRLSGDILARVEQVTDDHMGTNLVAVFETILRVAEGAGVAYDDMPDTVIIISDMEFDAVRGTNLEAIQGLFRDYGYPMPRIVFWNVVGRVGNAPAQRDEKGVVLMSGFSPEVVAGVLEGEIVSPLDVMLTVLGRPRYARITW